MVRIGRKKYFKVGEASRKLGISKDTLRRWDNSGEYQADRTLGRSRIYSPELMELLKQEAKGKKKQVKREKKKTIFFMYYEEN